MCLVLAAVLQGMVYGEGVHMGLPVVWAFFWRPDGAWYEEVRAGGKGWGCVSKYAF